MYPFERFMGYAKRMVRNKARVEGSIVAAYVRRETNYFISHYFNPLMLNPRNIRNEVIVESEGFQSALSVFSSPRTSLSSREIFLDERRRVAVSDNSCDD